MAFLPAAFLTDSYAAAFEADFRAVFLGAGCFACAASEALFAAQRFRVASPMAFLAEALIFLRLAFTGSGDAGSVSAFNFAQRAFWAAAIFRREAALNCRRLSVAGAAVGVEATVLPSSIDSTSAICS
jgi:hypothetical protein